MIQAEHLVARTSHCVNGHSIIRYDRVEKFETFSKQKKGCWWCLKSGKLSGGVTEVCGMQALQGCAETAVLLGLRLKPGIAIPLIFERLRILITPSCPTHVRTSMTIIQCTRWEEPLLLC